jgi:hypothetical protein
MPVVEHAGRPMLTRNPRHAKGGVSSSRTAMEFDPLLSLEGWKHVGERIGMYSDAASWWLGDWLNFGRMKYGRRYKEGIAITGLEYQTLRNYAMVARRFDVSRRRDGLSFQHHAEVCALQNEEQEQWLDLSVDNSWSKAKLRRALAAHRARPDQAGGTVFRIVLEPTREDWWRAAATRSGCALEVWVKRVLDAAARVTPPSAGGQNR